MKKSITILSLVLISSTVFANEIEFDRSLNRGLVVADVILSCKSQYMSAKTEKCVVALNEAAKLQISPEELARAMRIQKINSEDRVFDAKLRHALDETENALTEKREELLRTLEYNK